MGMDNAARVFEDATEISRPDAVISLGYCGGLLPGVDVGDLVWASAVFLIDASKTEALPLPGHDMVFDRLSSSVPIRRGTFFTLGRWMTKAEILTRVPEGTDLPVCDMETYAIARLALERRLPFFALRAVSDDCCDEVGFDPLAVCDASGTFSLSRSLLFFGSRPHLVARAMKLGRGSAVASRSISRATEVLLQML
jgi:adenosylhomocysteine nucleosidase